MFCIMILDGRNGNGNAWRVVGNVAACKFLNKYIITRWIVFFFLGFLFLCVGRMAIGGRYAACCFCSVASLKNNEKQFARTN